MRKKGTAPLASIDHCVVSDTAAALRVSVTVRNLSERPVFVTVDLRRIEFDAASQTVTLRFSDRDRDLSMREAGQREYTVPQTHAIEAGKTHSFEVPLPRKLNRLLAHDDGTFDVEVLDLSRVRRVNVRCCVADQPFYFNPKRGPLLEQLGSWGGDVSGGADRETHTDNAAVAT